MARVLCARSAHVALRYSLLSKLQWWENWMRLGEQEATGLL